MSIIKVLEEAKLSKFHYILLVVCSLIYCFTAMNVMLIAAVLTPIIKDFGLEKDPFLSGILVSSGYVGMFLGALSCGILADHIGRRKTLIITTLTMSIFTALNAFARDPLTMIFLRFIAGIGLGGSLPQPGVYISEYVPAKYRGRFLGLVETSWVYGALLSLLFPYIILPRLGWRLTFFIALIPLFLIPLILLYTPESLRYMQIKGMFNEAINTIKRYGLFTGEISAKDLFTSIEKYNVYEALRELWSKNYWNRTLLLWILWIVLVYTYHGIFIWLPTIYFMEFGITIVKSIEWTLMVTLAQIPGYYSATLMLDRIGRKPILILYLALAGFGSLMLGLSIEVSHILLWSVVISFFNLGAWSGLYAYTPELYPTRIRGTGSGTAASMGRIAGIIAPTATPLLYTYFGLKTAFIVFSLIHFIGSLATLIFGIETKGKVLEELAKN
ncbi:MAG: MFS transporter [Candidatus Methanomethylicia archaeon]